MIRHRFRSPAGPVPARTLEFVMRRTVTALAAALLAVSVGILSAVPAVAAATRPTVTGQTVKSGHTVKTSPYVALVTLC